MHTYIQKKILKAIKGYFKASFFGEIAKISIKTMKTVARLNKRKHEIRAI
tara:strand:+ start:13 stop:162 length:150 start_codon:yes stop_codon:yes gene_type:complete